MTPAVSDRTAYAGITLVSASILGFLLWLIYLRPPSTGSPPWIHAVPAAGAVFNALSASCLVAAVAAIRRSHLRFHVGFVLGALSCSALFLAAYILHHAYHGDTRFAGEGGIRTLYFLILISHVLLSTGVLPLIFATLFLALTGRFPRHRRLARLTVPVWLYVSVTGIAVFLLLRRQGWPT